MADRPTAQNPSSSLGRRLLSSFILVPLLVLVFYSDAKAGSSAPYLLVLCLLLAVRGAWELLQLLSTRSFRPGFVIPAGCTVLVILAGWWTAFVSEGESAGSLAAMGPVALAYGISVLILFLKNAITYREPGSSMETLGAELMTVSYMGVLLSLTAQLRWVSGAEAGYLVLGSLVIAAKCGDIGAYTLGRLFGKRKLIPRLSPGKTWMGAWGAVIGSGLGGWAWLELATPLFDETWSSPAWCWSIFYGIAIGISGLIGDLCESLIKRDVGKKDSASLMPGFGGLLDLLDSVLFAGPVAFILWQVMPLATWK